METSELIGEVPEMAVLHKFWSDIWETEGIVNQDAAWMKEVEEEIKQRVKTNHSPQVVDKTRLRGRKGKMGQVPVQMGYRITG